MEEMVEIYRKYMPQVYNFLFSLCHDAHLSEELTQETFYRAVKKINTYKGECKISVWLCQIAKNLWYDKCRRDKRLVHIEESELFNIQTLNNIEDDIISKEEKRLLNRKIQKLDEKTREVIYLRIVGELTFKEIGVIMDKTENWARVTFYRGKNKMKEVDEYGK